jgi:uncharacterized protein YqjF (DUF2071 family)
MQKFLTAEWRKLIMANYEVSPSLLQPMLPAGTEIDRYNNKAFVSLVGFMFNNTKVLGVKIPFHINFPEVNLRFYVRFKEKTEWRRGVVFIREIVPKPAITFVANSLFKEKYVTLPMQYSIDSGNGLKVSYRWKHKKAWYSVEAEADNIKQTIAAGSEEEFITHQSAGYSVIRPGVTSEYLVYHPLWELYPVQRYNIACDFEKVYGRGFGFLCSQSPQSVYLVEGSPVTVYNKRVIDLTAS